MKQVFAAQMAAVPRDHKHLTRGQSNLRCAQRGKYTSDLKHLEPQQKGCQVRHEDFYINHMLGG